VFAGSAQHLESINHPLLTDTHTLHHTPLPASLLCWLCWCSLGQPCWSTSATGAGSCARQLPK
jgi:hypothetical protein